VNEQEVIGANALQVLRRRNGDWWESLLEKAWQEPRYITEHFDAPKKQWLRISSYQSPDGLGMLISDITQQHLLEDTLNQFEFTIEAVVNASDDWIWAINPDRKLLAANRRFYEATQTKHNDYLLQDSLLANRPDAPWFEEWKMMYAGAFAGHKMERLMHHPASLHESPTIDLRMYPIKNEEGKVVCVGCFAHDASRRIQHEQQLHSQQKKLTEIAWEQSHEIRAPLANILGIIQLIEQEQALSQTEVRHYLYELNMAACQLDAVIRKIVAKTGNVAS
jgi:PAS domain-containing protein